MTGSPKYERELNGNEEKRVVELVNEYEKATNLVYHWEVINIYSNETLSDIACSEARYKQMIKYYKWLKNQIRIDMAINEEREMDEDELAALNMCNTNVELKPGEDIKMYRNMLIVLISEEEDIDILKELIKNII